MSGSPLLTSQRELICAAMQLGAAMVAGWSQREGLLASGCADRAYNALASARRDSPSREPHTRDSLSRDSLTRDPPARDSPSTIEELRAQIRNGADPLVCAFIQLHALPRVAPWVQPTRPAKSYNPCSPGPPNSKHRAHRRPRHWFRSVSLASCATVSESPTGRRRDRSTRCADSARKPRGRRRCQQKRRDTGRLPGDRQRSDERTLFVGNPPYVRHHLIDTRWKQWHAAGWQDLGITASRLAGLHVHFFLSTLLNARGGDYGAFVTSAEWLDVNYGSALRDSFLGNLGGAELGELCRVHRGQATGANRIWIINGTTQSLPPSVLFPIVTRAREPISAGAVLSHTDHLRNVIDLPEDLDELDCETRSAVETFLHEARCHGAHATYVARHRAKWWSVGLRPAAPILVNYLSSAVSVVDGRTYAGGLTKFEPREMERIWVPRPVQNAVVDVSLG